MVNNLKQKIRTGIGMGIIGIGLGGLVSGGCATEEEAMLGKMLGVGMQTSPHASPDERTFGAMIDAGSQASLNSYNAEKMGTKVNVYVGNNPQKFYTTEIYNLDTGKKEIEIVGHWWIDYALDKMEDNKFPSNGYEMIQKINGKMVESSIINQKIEGEWLWVKRGNEKLAGRKRGAGHFP